MSPAVRGFVTLLGLGLSALGCFLVLISLLFGLPERPGPPSDPISPPATWAQARSDMFGMWVLMGVIALPMILLGFHLIGSASRGNRAPWRWVITGYVSVMAFVILGEGGLYLYLRHS